MRNLFILLLATFFLTSCKKEISNVYEIDPVYIQQNGQKGNLKSDLQFISIAYADLFGRQAKTDELNTMLDAYNSMGDKALIIDLMIRSLITQPGVIAETQAQMQTDPETFIQKSFHRFFIRNATEMEVWYFKKLIETESQLLPEDLYYVLMSAEEYRYY